jgi:hypothetical protein
MVTTAGMVRAAPRHVIPSHGPLQKKQGGAAPPAQAGGASLPRWHPFGVGWLVLPGGQCPSTAYRRWACLYDLHDACLMAFAHQDVPTLPTGFRGWPSITKMGGSSVVRGHTPPREPCKVHDTKELVASFAVPTRPHLGHRGARAVAGVTDNTRHAEAAWSGGRMIPACFAPCTPESLRARTSMRFSSCFRVRPISKTRNQLETITVHRASWKFSYAFETGPQQ